MVKTSTRLFSAWFAKRVAMKRILNLYALKAFIISFWVKISLKILKG